MWRFNALFLWIFFITVAITSYRSLWAASLWPIQFPFPCLHIPWWCLPLHSNFSMVCFFSLVLGNPHNYLFRPPLIAHPLYMPIPPQSLALSGFKYVVYCPYVFYLQYYLFCWFSLVWSTYISISTAWILEATRLPTIQHCMLQCILQWFCRSLVCKSRDIVILKHPM